MIPYKSHPKIGVLLINLGTPDDASVKSVRRFLREFLCDPRVIDLPTWLRWPLVNLVILPFRSRKSTRAYQKIWREGGSPLRIYSQQLADKVQQKLGTSYVVALGMRYGSPSIQSALQILLRTPVSKIRVLPLFPQYSSASTGSAIAEVERQLKLQHSVIPLETQNAFYHNPDFIQQYAKQMASHIREQSIDHLLFSYHGLPQRHVDQHDYRAQCYQTTQQLANALNLSPTFYSTAFQSRLGRAPWIQPYTHVMLETLAKQGVKNICVVCPSFVADCLETLEEIGIRAKAQWKSLGGDTLTLIPCLNAQEEWVDVIVKWVAQENHSRRKTPSY